MSIAARKPPETAEEHGWAEHRMIHASDVDLCAAGFRVVARPKSSEARWTRSGMVYTERQALALMRAEDV